MIHSLSIIGYRTFDHFSMAGLGQVNLLVGRNNSGKTSVLEALYLLACGGDPAAIWRVMNRRGEQIPPDPAGQRPQMEIEVCHLFHGHELKAIDTTFEISTTNEVPGQSIVFKLIEAKQQENAVLFAQMTQIGEGAAASRPAIAITGQPAPMAPLLPLTQRGGLRPEVLQFAANPQVRPRPGVVAPRTRTAANAQYVSTESLSIAELLQYWNAISLTPVEERVLSALRYLDPKIERLAPASVPNPAVFAGYSGYPGFPMRGGFKVKLSDMEQPVPIGSLGDGTWRMLALAIVLSRSKDSLLLIDEIDAGFHYTVMADMWRFIADTARNFNVQVFATTHSGDCVNSLASICHDDVRVGSQVSIQRIEPERETAVAYTEAEIKAAAEQHIEMR